VSGIWVDVDDRGIHTAIDRPTSGSCVPPLTWYSCNRLAATIAETGHRDFGQIEGMVLRIWLLHAPFDTRSRVPVRLPVVHQKAWGTLLTVEWEDRCTKSESTPVDS
jgi:hypothetical protein